MSENRNGREAFRKDNAQQGILVVVSGFSGSGKGTIMERLVKKYPDDYALSISATTRTPRQGEIDGKNYFFTSRAQFFAMIEKGELIEYAEYVNNFYGTPEKYVREQLLCGKDVILEIEIQGAQKVKEKFPDTLLLFVTPPGAAELKKRLIKRGTEEQSIIDSRLARAFEEAQGIEEYDYLIINDRIDDCVENVNTIIKNEHFRVTRNSDLIGTMRQELKGFSKGE